MQPRLWLDTKVGRDERVSVEHARFVKVANECQLAVLVPGGQKRKRVKLGSPFCVACHSTPHNQNGFRKIASTRLQKKCQLRLRLFDNHKSVIVELSRFAQVFCVQHERKPHKSFCGCMQKTCANLESSTINESKGLRQSLAVGI